MARRDDMLTAYRLALSHQTEYRQRIEQLRVEHPNDTTFMDIHLQASDAAVGHIVQDHGGITHRTDEIALQGIIREANAESS